jgi:hypothetical protein
MKGFMVFDLKKVFNICKRKYISKEAYVIIGDGIRKRILDREPMNGRFPPDNFWHMEAFGREEFIPESDVFDDEESAKNELIKRLILKKENVELKIYNLINPVNVNDIDGYVVDLSGDIIFNLRKKNDD